MRGSAYCDYKIAESKATALGSRHSSEYAGVDRPDDVLPVGLILTYWGQAVAQTDTQRQTPRHPVSGCRGAPVALRRQGASRHSRAER